MHAAGVTTAVLLAASLTVASCGRQVARPAAAGSTPLGAPAERAHGASGQSTWIWWTAAGILAAAGVAALLAFVIVPAIAEGTARGVAENAGTGPGDDGRQVLPL